MSNIIEQWVLIFDELVKSNSLFDQEWLVIIVYYRFCKRGVKDCETLGLWYDGDMLETALYSAIAPFVLLLLSSAWKYPAVLEEVVKWGLLRIGTENREYHISNGVVVGLIFGLSESVLFTMNAWTGGEWSAIGLRLLLTVPMHVLTAMMTALGMKKKITLAMLILAMLMHAGFNYLAKSIL